MDDLKLIKKYYGENMMHLCRELFPTILETPGLLFKLIDDSFEHSKFLYDDIINEKKQDKFKDFIYGKIGVKEEPVVRDESPHELFKEIGYNLYECKTEEDIQSFKKYYAYNEALCTFNGGRLNRNHVFFAVKENVDEIKRKNFSDPKREDEYGTSVISIQFTRGDINTLSIKNRYNHTVDNPDATFSNNLENIISGLTKSFERSYNLNINQNDSNGLKLSNYVLARDGRFYKYNYEINNIYYCPDNIIIDNFEVNKLEKEKYIVADYFIIDLVNKRINLYAFVRGECFTEDLNNIKKITVEKDKNTSNRNIILTPEEGSEIFIQINKFNQIIGYENNNVEKIDVQFLRYNTTMKWLRMLNVSEIDSDFLSFNKDLNELEMPKLKVVFDYFLAENRALEKLSLPSLVEAGDYFLQKNQRLNYFCAPKLKILYNEFLYSNQGLKDLDLPSLEKVDRDFLYNNLNLENINCPSIKIIGIRFLFNNNLMKDITLPNVVQIGEGFMAVNNTLESACFPMLNSAGKDFLFENRVLRNFDACNLKECDSLFFYNNKCLRQSYAPKITTDGNETYVLRK